MPDAWRAEVERRIRRRRRIAGSKARRDADFEMCRRSFWHWTIHYGWMYNPHETDEPARRLVPFVPWESQRELMSWLLERLEAGQEALVPKSRKIGVTWLVLHYLWWCHRFQPGFTALLGSRKEDLVDQRGNMDSLFEKLRWIGGKQPAWLGPGAGYVDKHMILVDPELGTELVGESTNAGFGQGGRRTIVFIDEAGKVDTATMRLIWTAVESVAKSIWLVFNPPPLASHFIWKVRMEADPSRVYPMTWHADPTRPEDFKARTVRPAGRLTESEFAEQYECQAGAVVPGRIWPVSVPELLYNDDTIEAREARERFPTYGSMDFGTSVMSRLVFLLGIMDKREPWKIWVEHDPSWIRTTWMQAGADIRSVLSGYQTPFRGAFFDPSGYGQDSSGSSWVLNLQQAGINFIDLKNTVDGQENQWKLNTTEWIAWSIRWVLAFLTDERIRVHERCTYLRQCIAEYRYDVKLGSSELDYAGTSPKKNDASHGADALRHLHTGFLWTLDAEREEGRSRGQVYETTDLDALTLEALGDENYFRT